MRKSLISLIAVAAIAFVAIQPVNAQTFGQTGLGFLEFGLPIAAGGLPPANGFPVSFTDTPDGVGRGITLGQCLNGGVGCLPDPAFIPPAGPALDVNFPPEFFYFLAGPAITLPAPAAVTVVEYALEAGWGGVGAQVDGNQAVFQRIRYRLTGLLPGSTLTIDHPWGTDSMPVDATGEVNQTADIPGLVAGAFAQAQTATLIGPVLTAVAPAPPPGFIGTCGGAQTVTGGPLRNTLTLSGTDAAGAAFNVTTDRWDICGQLFAGGVREPVAHMHLDATGAGRVDIEAIGISATGLLDVTGVGTPLPTEVPPAAITMLPQAGQPGRFFATVPVAAGNVLPDSVLITVDRAAATQGISPNVVVTDLVTMDPVAPAVFDETAGTLTVKAASSNLSTPKPVLTVTGAGIPAFQVDSVTGTGTLGIAAAPTEVTVTSTDGGTATSPVAVINPIQPPPVDGGGGIIPAAGGGGGGGGGCFIDTLFGK